MRNIRAIGKTDCVENADDQIAHISPENRTRIRQLLIGIGADPMHGTTYLEVWLAEHRMRAERLASQRLTRATWALAAVTFILAGATIALVIATFQLA
jgi:hypothetical protein